MARIGKLAFFICIVIAFSSCKKQSDMNETPDLHIVLANTGDRQIWDSTAKIGDFKSDMGILAPGSSKTYLYFNHPLTEYATVDFGYRNGENFTKTVQIKGVIPDKIKGDLELIFNIDSNTNEVSLDYIIE